MRLLVLGGTRFVGRALVEDAVARGWQVTALNRGVTGSVPAGVTALVADRTSPDQLRDALGDKEFDAVVDTWSSAPQVVATAVEALKGRAPRYAYVSSISVYAEGRPLGGDETWATVEADPDAEATDYAADKRGAELAVLRGYPDGLLARPGLILGPHEDIGRLPWWLLRAARGGRIPAPGRPDRPIQYVDVRDLADWVLDGLADGLGGAVDLVCPSGHTTTQTLLESVVSTVGSGELVWIPEEQVLTCVTDPWTQLPCWVPETPEWLGLMECDTSQAIGTDLHSRPVVDTVRDTWAWLQAEGPAPQRSDRPVYGLPPETEERLLASVP